MSGALPAVGEVYWVDTTIFFDRDTKLRPAVVVAAPRFDGDSVTVIERTKSQFHLAGVLHDKDPSLRLNEAGKWIRTWRRTATGLLFRDPYVELVGELDPAILQAILDDQEQW